MNTEKLVQTLAVMAAGFVATKGLDFVWRKVTGHKPTLDPDSTDVKLREVVLFAAISGALAALARAGATRASANYVARRANSLSR